MCCPPKAVDILESDLTGEYFTWNSWHMSGCERKLVQNGQAYYIPIKYSEVPRWVRENLQTDVVVIQVAPMDEHGYFSFWVTVSHYAAAIKKGTGPHTPSRWS